MTWRDPNLFWLLAAVAAVAGILIYASLRRTAALGGFVDEPLVERLARGLSERRRSVRLGLRVVALAATVVALAGPKYGFHWEEVQRQGIDLLVAMDTSRSMLAVDVKPNRLERAKLAVLDLLPRLSGDRIGLVAYSGTAFLEAPLTLDYSAFARSLRALQVGIIPRGGTSLSRAIETSLEGFEAREGKYEALILISDGEDHEGDALDAAKKASERGVKIYTVGIGTPEGEILPLSDGGGGYVKDRKGQVVKSRLNETLLRDIALESGGAYVRGLGPQLGLDQVFDEHIAKMERREVDSGLERRYEERFQIPLLFAIFLLLVETMVGERKRDRVRSRIAGWRERFSRMGGAGAALVLAVALFSADGAEAGLLDGEPDPINTGVELFEAGEYEEAVSKFGEALVESPASPLLQFNLAAALYKQGRYEEAIAPLEKVAAEGGDEWSARANYNLGNAHFRIGSGAEESAPQEALESWAQALVSYRRAMAADPAMDDVKFNYELVERRIEELRERLEQEQEEQEQKEQEQQDQDGEQEEQEQESEQEQQDQDGDQEQEQDSEQEQQQQDEQEQQQEQQQGEQEQQPEQQQGDEQEQQPQAEEQGEEEQPPQPEEAEEQQDDSAGDPAEQEQQEMAEQPSGGAGEAAPSEEQQAAQQAAQAVLDVAREEELGPEEVGRKVGVAGIGDPSQDW